MLKLPLCPTTVTFYQNVIIVTTQIPIDILKMQSKPFFVNCCSQCIPHMSPSISRGPRDIPASIGGCAECSRVLGAEHNSEFIANQHHLINYNHRMGDTCLGTYPALGRLSVFDEPKGNTVMHHNIQGG